MFEFRRVIWIFLNEKLQNGTKRLYVLNSNSRELLYELVYILNLNLFESFIWVTTWIYNVWLYARSTYGLKHSFSSVAILYCISSFKFKCCRNASQLRALCPVHWDLNITYNITENEFYLSMHTYTYITSKYRLRCINPFLYYFLFEGTTVHFIRYIVLPN